MASMYVHMTLFAGEPVFFLKKYYTFFFFYGNTLKKKRKKSIGMQTADKRKEWVGRDSIALSKLSFVKPFSLRTRKKILG